MKANMLALFLSLAIAGTAGANTTIAGWDFSQYRGDGLLSTDGTTFTTTLPANYSGLDPTHNAGAESATYGTLYMNGANGSTSVSAGVNAQVVPVAGSLQSNLAGPATEFGMNSFDALTVQAAEGQRFQQRLALTARAAASIVFEADFTSAPGAEAGDYYVTFAGRTLLGTGSAGGELSCDPTCSSTVGLDFSPDGSSWTSAGNVVLDTTDEHYAVVLGPNTTDRGFVRMNLNPTGGQPVIDNVAIGVPEPAKALQLAAGLLSLAWLYRRRRA